MISCALSDAARAWWPIVKPGGAVIGDDYCRDGTRPGVRRAFDEFFGEQAIEFGDSKCRVRKPLPNRVA